MPEEPSEAAKASAIHQVPFVSLRIDVVVLPGPSGLVYPTDGQGGYASGDPFVDGYLRNSASCTIDAIQCTFNSSGGGITLYDALGNPLDKELVFSTPMPQPYGFRLDLPVLTAGGFQIDCVGYSSTDPPPPVIGNGAAFSVLFHDTSGH